MMKDSNNLDFLDMLNILSFVIGVMNYGENITQGDMQEVAQALSQHTSDTIADVHSHLQEQDRHIEEILRILRGEQNEI